MFQFRYKESKTGMVEALHDPPSSSGVIRLMLHQRYTIQSHEKSNLCNFVTSFSVQNVCRNLHPASGGFWELAFAFFSEAVAF